MNLPHWLQDMLCAALAAALLLLADALINPRAAHSAPQAGEHAMASARQTAQHYPPAYTYADSAKLLGIGQRKLIKLLRADNIINDHNLPYQRYIDAGYLRVRTGHYDHPTIGTKFYGQALITNHGLTWLQKRIAEKQEAEQLQKLANDRERYIRKKSMRESWRLVLCKPWRP
jgi:hypothetical protein